MSRTWIIIEDDYDKAEGIIPYILRNHQDDKICWIYPYSRDFPEPRLFEAKLQEKLTYYHTDIDQVVNGEQLTGVIDFYWCTDEDTFTDVCKIALTENSILLLDIELDALGLNRFAAPLKEVVNRFLGLKKILVSLTTTQFNPFKIALELTDENDKRILAGDYVFQGRDREEDFEKLVKASDERWIELYTSRFSFVNFLEKMSEHSADHFHNWTNGKKFKSDGAPIWDQKWDMPIQLKWLIEVLHYDKKQFLEDLSLTPKLQNTRALGECLKTLGTSNTNGINLLAALLICWIAFRKLFAKQEEEKKIEDVNKKFIMAINSCEKKEETSYSVNENICRYSLITPPQHAATYQKTAIALFDMMSILLKHKKTANCTIHHIDINERRLRIDLEMKYEKLSTKLGAQYRHKFIKKDSSSKGGDASVKIIEFFRWSNYFDGTVDSINNKPFLSSKYGLKIHPSELSNGKVGVTLKFGC